MRTSSHHHDENNNNDDERIKLVVWDFDMTILRIHSFAKRISALDVPRRDYERDCADANFFRAFLREMKQKSIKVAIASFGKREVIETYLKCLVDGKKGDEDLAEYAFNEKKKSIVTPNDVGGTDGCSMKDKSRMLDALTKRYVLSMNEEDISSAQGVDPVESSSASSSLFGKREVIETYLKCLVDGKKGDEDLAEYAFNEKKKSIVTPNDVGGTDGCSMKDKSRMLDALTKRYVLSMNEEDISSAQVVDPVESSSASSSLLGKARKQVVFFDDDEDNVNAAKKLGYAYAVHTPNAFERES